MYLLKLFWYETWFEKLKCKFKGSETTTQDKEKLIQKPILSQTSLKMKTNEYFKVHFQA